METLLSIESSKKFLKTLNFFWSEINGNVAPTTGDSEKSNLLTSSEVKLMETKESRHVVHY